MNLGWSHDEATPSFIQTNKEKKMLQSFKPVRHDAQATWNPRALMVESMEKVCMIVKAGDARPGCLFRIGSINNMLLDIWEPGTPSFEKRLEFLKLLHSLGYDTIVAIAPMLDYRADELVKAVRPYVTNSIQIGRGNPIKMLLANGCDPADFESRLYQLQIIQSDSSFQSLYERLKGDPLIRWIDNVERNSAAIPKKTG